MAEAGQSSKEKTAARVPPCKVTFTVGDGEEARKGLSLHFNAAGLLVICPEPAPLKSMLTLSLQFTGMKHSVEVQGEVVWSNIYGSADNLSPRGMGVKFLNVERDTERILSELAEKFDTLGNVYECYYT